MLTSGSGLERHINCRMSNVLPRAFDTEGTDDTTRGKEAHSHLQRVGEGMEEQESLDMVEERFRDACAGIDLVDLDDVLGLTAELTLAYKPMDDTARVLGVALDREYEAAGLQDDEVPVTMDVVGLDKPVAPTRGSVIDWKTGWAQLARAGRNWQMRGGALALSRAFDLDDVDAQLIYLREGVPARRDRAVFTAADLAGFAAEARARWVLSLEDRARRERTGALPDATQGSWCRYCPSFHACPPKVALIRSLVSGEIDDLTRIAPVSPEGLADAYRKLQDLKAPLKLLERSIYAAARERPVLLERTADGTEVWLGTTLVQSPERIDAVKARIVVSEMLGVDAVDEVSTFSVTKKRLDEAIRKRVPKGAGADKMRAVLAELRKRGGAHRPTKHEVDVYRLKPRTAALSAAKGDG